MQELFRSRFFPVILLFMSGLVVGCGSKIVIGVGDELPFNGHVNIVDFSDGINFGNIVGGALRGNVTLDNGP